MLTVNTLQLVINDINVNLPLYSNLLGHISVITFTTRHIKALSRGLNVQQSETNSLSISTTLLPLFNLLKIPCYIILRSVGRSVGGRSVVGRSVRSGRSVGLTP